MRWRSSSAAVRGARALAPRMRRWGPVVAVLALARAGCASVGLAARGLFSCFVVLSCARGDGVGGTLCRLGLWSRAGRVAGLFVAGRRDVLLSLAPSSLFFCCVRPVPLGLLRGFCRLACLSLFSGTACVARRSCSCRVRLAGFSLRVALCLVGAAPRLLLCSFASRLVCFRLFALRYGWPNCGFLRAGGVGRLSVCCGRASRAGGGCGGGVSAAAGGLPARGPPERAGGRLCVRRGSRLCVPFLLAAAPALAVVVVLFGRAGGQVNYSSLFVPWSRASVAVACGLWQRFLRWCRGRCAGTCFIISDSSRGAAAGCRDCTLDCPVVWTLLLVAGGRAPGGARRRAAPCRQLMRLSVAGFGFLGPVYVRCAP